jgi:hypothetical protein
MNNISNEKISLRFVNKDGTQCSAKECLRILGDMNYAYGWLGLNELKDCGRWSKNKSEDECEKFLDELERNATYRHGYWYWSC